MNRKQFFDEIAQGWEKEHDCLKEKKKLEDLVKYFPLSPGNWVLDAGCGTGRLIPFIRRAIGENGFLVELDLSLAMLKIGQKKYYFSRTGFIQSPAEIIPFKDNIFDAVICLALFPHLSEKKQALKEFYRVLKPGSSLLIAHPMGREDLNRFHSQVEGPVKKDFLPPRKKMEELFSQACFRNLTIDDKPSLYIAQALV